MKGGKIAGLDPKLAIGIAVVVFVGVWWYMRRQSSGVPTQTQTTPSVGTSYPAGTDSTGGAAGGSGSGAPMQSPYDSTLISALIAQEQAFTAAYTAPPQPSTSYYYAGAYQSPTTTSYTYNYTGTAPPAPTGSVNSNDYTSVPFVKSQQSGFELANAVAAGAISPSFLSGLDPNTAAGRFAQTVAQQRQAAAAQPTPTPAVRIGAVAA